MSFKCYLCGNTHSIVKAESREIRFNCYFSDKRVLECLACGMVQLYPQWNVGELEMLYKTYSQKQDFKGQKRKIRISKYLQKMMCQKERVIEIGAGHGDNVMYLRSKGFNVLGIDKDPTVKSEAVITVDVNAYVPPIKPDVIYGIHFLEHLADPIKFITWTIQTLSEKGRFIFEIPNIDDPLLRLYKVKAFNRFYWYPYHHFFYTEKTAKTLFSRFINVNVSFEVKQEYGLLNHLRWIFCGKPGNVNFHIPILDNIYKSVLGSLGFGDTLVIVGEKCTT